MSYEGPFVLDRSHPLTEGLSLDAIIWSAARDVVPAGTPVITAGNRVLMADSEDASGRHRLQIVLEPELSNLTGESRLADSGGQPGPLASGGHARAGCLERAAGSDPENHAGRRCASPRARPLVTLPGGAEQSLPIHGKQLEVHPDRIGLYNVRAGSLQFPFACNALNADESNLADCATGSGVIGMSRRSFKISG